MKLRSDFIIQTIDDSVLMVPIGGEAFKGVINGNESAGFIIELLKNDVDEKAIVDAMCSEYDAPREVIAADVKEILATLRSVNALDE